MAIEFATLIGLIASVFSIAAFIPQVIRTWKTKKAEDLSMSMLVAFISGTLLWFVYGLLINSLPVIVANLVISILVIILMMLKLRYK